MTTEHKQYMRLTFAHNGDQVKMHTYRGEEKKKGGKKKKENVR